MHPAESVIVVAPVAQQRSANGSEWKVLAHTVSRIGVAGDDESAVHRAGSQESVHDLQCGEDATRSVRDVE